MQDEPKPQPEPLEEVDLSNGARPRRPIFISKTLDEEFKAKLVALLGANADIFAWHYEEMPDFRHYNGHAPLGRLSKFKGSQAAPKEVTIQTW